MNLVPCPMCSTKAGRCLDLCVDGAVDVDKLARSLYEEERAICYAEALGYRPSPLTDEEWVNNHNVREYWLGQAARYLKELA